MGRIIGIAGQENTGKSFGRRYIPDGNNVMIIAPSPKTAHLFTGPKGVESMTTQEIDAAIKSGKRKPIKYFDIKSPEGKYNNLEEAMKLVNDPAKKSLLYTLHMIKLHKPKDYFIKEGIEKAREYLSGNFILCEDIENLSFYISFIAEFMPWIHTIILPDFTHFISEKITSAEFIAKKTGGEQYSKYLDLAADSLRGFIKSADKLRHNLIMVTEFHAHRLPESEEIRLFLPGGKMFEEKFLPASYYDDLFFTNVRYGENEDELPQYEFITRKTKVYPQARSSSGFDELYIPNNLQEVLTQVRKYNGIEITIQ